MARSAAPGLGRQRSRTRGRSPEAPIRAASGPGLACSLLLLALVAGPSSSTAAAEVTRPAEQPQTVGATAVTPQRPPPEPSPARAPLAAGRPPEPDPAMPPPATSASPLAVSAPRAAASTGDPNPTPIPRPVSEPTASGASGRPASSPLPGPLPSGLPAPSGSSPEPELGVWLTTVDSAVMYDPAEAEQALAFLRHNGFRRAALPLYTAGVVTWTPAPSNNRLGIPTDPLLPPSTAAVPGAESTRHHGSTAPAESDPAGSRRATPQSPEAARAAALFGPPAAPSARTGTGFVHGVGPTASLLAALGHAGLERVGWFEFGLMAPAGAPWLAGRDDLLLRDASGSTFWQESPGLNRVWLNPILPEVQHLLEGLVVDACSNLPLEVLQFDDHLGYPVGFGYDPATLAAWRTTDAGRRDPNPLPQNRTWIAWRAEQVTALLERLRAAMNTACPAVRISVSPNPQEFSYSHYLADWSGWVRRGLVDEVVVQIYRDNLASLRRELAHPSLGAAARQVPVRIGLLAGLRSQPKHPAQLLRELELVQGLGYRGIDLFFYESARHHFSEPATPQRNEAGLGPVVEPRP